MKLLEAISEDMMSHLIDLCREMLELEELPEINLIDDQPYIQGGDKRSFGVFHDNTIHVVTMDRHPIDVMRTFAHEITHWKQKQLGMDMDGNDGSETENEANAFAGVIMRKFGERYPDYFLNSLPDY
jgi:hypothetical protein